MVGISNVNAANANGNIGMDAESGSGGGILAAICGAFCKDNPLGQQLGLNQMTASPTDAPVTSQSKDKAIVSPN